MYVRHRLNFLWLAAVLLLLARCAQVVTPNGGAKDTRPPVAVKYSPDSAAVNANAQRVVIEFNEYVTLSNVNEQLIISPPLANPPEVSIRRREVVIDFKDTLRPNTTYTLSFGNSIRDITEGNVLDNFRYVFSTGPVVDSLRIRGRVTDAFTLAGEKEALVILYNTAADSAPLKMRPWYFTKTRADGSFELTNLRAGSYKVVAITDKNADYLWQNAAGERIAYRDSLLTLNANCDTLQLRLFQQTESRQRVRNTVQVAPGKVMVYFAFPAKKPELRFTEPLSPQIKLFTERNRTGDTLTLWFSSNTTDTLGLIAADGGEIFDTAEVRIFDPNDKRFRPRGGQPDARKLMVYATVNNNQKADLYSPLAVLTSIPVREFNAAGIILTRGRDTLRINPQLDSLSRRRIQLLSTLQEDSAYKLVVLPNTVTDWFGQRNKDTITINFQPRTPDDYGNLKVTTRNLKPGNYLLQLLNEKGLVVNEYTITSDQSVSFEHLLPGQYALRLITDTNKNGRYDSGNYTEHRQPEIVKLYGGNVKVRAGWDLDIDWKMKKQ
ncbi:MAG: Ig-like domain-containing protein [Bacteroidetes bacterium]|nr:Ig-like domain-containing protein [Bacteroidota bacterium]